MGLNTTSTMASSKSFGFSRGKKRLLTTYSFPSGTSTWTAPAGVTSLASAVGRGSNGGADTWNSVAFRTLATYNSGIQYYCSNPSVGSTLPYSTYNSYWQSIYSQCDGITTSSSGQYYGSLTNGYAFFYCSAAGQWVVRTDAQPGGTYRKTTLSGSAPPSSGDVPITDGFARYDYIYGIQKYSAGYNGTATTGFGLNFPGGTSTSPIAVDTSYFSIAVSPGTTYTINNNGSLTIEYYI